MIEGNWTDQPNQGKEKGKWHEGGRAGKWKEISCLNSNKDTQGGIEICKGLFLPLKDAFEDFALLLSFFQSKAEFQLENAFEAAKGY